MNTTNPPNEMARAYFGRWDRKANGERIFLIWKNTTGRYSRAEVRPDTFTAGTVRHDVSLGWLHPILEWGDVKQDAGHPDYVMYPKDPDLESDFVGRILDTEKYGLTTDAWADLAHAKEHCSVVYKRLESHPQVLEKVWEREQDATALQWMGLSGKSYYQSAGVPVAEVPWDRVHAGKAVPPGRIVVTKGMGLSLGGAESGFAIRRNGEAWAQWGDVAIYASNSAAYYSIKGNLLGYRTADGWRDVVEATDRNPDGSGVTMKMHREGEVTTITDVVVHEADEPELSTWEKLHSMAGFTRTDTPKEPTFDTDLYVYGPNGVHARRRRAESLSYLQTNDDMTREGMTIAFGLGGFQLRDTAADAAQAERGELQKVEDAVRRELARRRGL